MPDVASVPTILEILVDKWSSRSFFEDTVNVVQVVDDTVFG